MPANRFWIGDRRSRARSRARRHEPNARALRQFPGPRFPRWTLGSRVLNFSPPQASQGNNVFPPVASPGAKCSHSKRTRPSPSDASCRTAAALHQTSAHASRNALCELAKPRFLTHGERPWKIPVFCRWHASCPWKGLGIRQKVEAGTGSRRARIALGGQSAGNAVPVACCHGPRFEQVM